MTEETTTTVTYEVTVTHPNDWTVHDVNDYMMFQLGLTGLTSVEVDYSAAEITQTRMRRYRTDDSEGDQ